MEHFAIINFIQMKALRSLKNICAVLVVAIVSLTLTQVYGQNGISYGNSWIDNNKSYLRILVKKPGIQRLKKESLPEGFSKHSSDKYQIWHRGKEVAIIKANETEILFYGETNDGATDSLVYRPASARLNPYVSLFSDEGSYFLTISESPKRMSVYDGSSLSGENAPFHIKKDVVAFTNQFAFTTFGVGRSLNNSFYEHGNSWTGTTIVGVNAVFGTAKDTELIKEYRLNNLVRVEGRNPSIELLVNGLYEGYHDIQIASGSDVQSLSKVKEIQFTGFGGRKTSFNLSDDILRSGKGFFKLNSLATNTSDWFGLSYYTVTYPQKTDMIGESSATFNFPSIGAATQRIGISNVPVNAFVLDITDSRNPVNISGVFIATTFEAMIPQKIAVDTKIAVFAANAVVDIPGDQIKSVNLSPLYSSPQKQPQSILNPKDYDYLIITSENLRDGAIQYAQYRSSPAGGSLKTLVMDIRDIYDQFNYGEPSPIAIREFARYMLKDGIRQDKHSLFLIGNSVSYPARLVKEMPNEVPTFGDPGSDILLVAGLGGKNEDVPPIGVGRINAFSSAEVLSYLSKVKAYEASNNFSWRKNVLHLNGGHSTGEITQLRDILSNLQPIVENANLGGKVKSFVKQNPGEVERVNISAEVNSGVGMITYFGHGSQTVTDLDMGYVTDAGRGYQNANKYPIMYFNGCGVGNIFTNRTSHLLSGNWLMSPDKGAIAIVSNSFDSYVTSSQKHLGVMYDKLFVKNAGENLGNIIRLVAEEIVASGGNAYDIANVHQFYLHGDPAITFISSSKADYSVSSENSIYLEAESESKTLATSEILKLKVVVSNLGKYVEADKIPVSIKVVTRNGDVSYITDEIDAVKYRDTISFDLKHSQILRSIEVILDDKRTLSEVNIDNNSADLLIDWDLAKNQTKYPTQTMEDVIVPHLSVFFNDRTILNGESIRLGSKIQFKIEDDRSLESGGISFIDVFFKDCTVGNCEFKLLPIDDPNFSERRLSSRMYEYEYDLRDVAPGDYELLVHARDSKGNVTQIPYSISFKIVGSEINTKNLSVSPNPASDFVRFSIKGTELYSKVSYLIYDIAGRLIKEENIRMSGIKSDSNEWYWYPESNSGLFLYKIIAETNDGIINTYSGKIVVTK